MLVDHVENQDAGLFGATHAIFRREESDRALVWSGPLSMLGEDWVVAGACYSVTSASTKTTFAGSSCCICWRSVCEHTR